MSVYNSSCVCYVYVFNSHIIAISAVMTDELLIPFKISVCSYALYITQILKIKLLTSSQSTSMLFIILHIDEKVENAVNKFFFFIFFHRLLSWVLPHAILIFTVQGHVMFVCVV